MGAEGFDADNDHVDVERDGAVGRVTMNRPAASNAVDELMAGGLRDAVIELTESDDDVRCVVLTGTDGWFSTGADLTTLAGDETDGRRLRALASRIHAAVKHMATAPKPVIAGVNGTAAGAGFGLAMAADLVVVSADASFEFAYPRLGLSGDAGITYRLPELVGHRRAREIALLDEPIDAERAVEMGLATEAVSSASFENRVDDLASELASGPTRALGATKRLIENSHGRSFEEHLQAETDTIARLAGTDDYERGYDAFFEDHEPEFRGE
ncbi:2-(1,2-epoxy-1,2-dihydrophenyl)acetyl-CoA isomerase [Natronoarchaeum philippinense]|uniref:2-(1,2-epoxy-1,2-dihydrophenyl)acetyl-CoA isomerase n=1 Tax=Natronoarchaeum philippinense TaxID=558529 RepID=A0A285N8Q2_NATPI|nr:enoyl-CoA hydratase-related protein [Natronoarchaeum philippinense]SNZ04346.1 2-(1,2-epoxy-1,2-dihydrophenyl)acetyl-CoA isomerase [Natronoarchaeum philippinense]